jgi:hypothetical protein
MKVKYPEKYDRSVRVWMRRYAGDGETLANIAKDMGISASRAGQLSAKGRKVVNQSLLFTNAWEHETLIKKKFAEIELDEATIESSRIHQPPIPPRC